MPFKSKAQMRAAFSGALGSKMKSRAKMWAKETPSIKSLPAKVKGPTRQHYKLATGQKIKENNLTGKVTKIK